jgi:hypothetical protein
MGCHSLSISKLYSQNCENHPTATADRRTLILPAWEALLTGALLAAPVKFGRLEDRDDAP